MPPYIIGIADIVEDPSIGLIAFTLRGKIHSIVFCKICVKAIETRYCDGSRNLSYNAEAKCTHVPGDE